MVQEKPELATNVSYSSTDRRFEINLKQTGVVWSALVSFSVTTNRLIIVTESITTIIGRMEPLLTNVLDFRNTIP